MAPLKNSRRERFAQSLAKGKIATEAMADAGYSPQSSNAARMIGNDSVRDRVTELQQRGAAKVEVTVASLIKEAEEARAGAMKAEQFSAAITAVREKGVLAGVRIERSERGEPGEFEGLSDEEFADRMNEKLVVLLSVDGQTEH